MNLEGWKHVRSCIMYLLVPISSNHNKARQDRSTRLNILANSKRWLSIKGILLNWSNISGWWNIMNNTYADTAYKIKQNHTPPKTTPRYLWFPSNNDTPNRVPFRLSNKMTFRSALDFVAQPTGPPLMHAAHYCRETHGKYQSSGAQGFHSTFVCNMWKLGAIGFWVCIFWDVFFNFKRHDLNIKHLKCYMFIKHSDLVSQNLKDDAEMPLKIYMPYHPSYR